MISIDSDRLAAVLDPLVLVAALREGHEAGSMPATERLLAAEDGTPNGCLVWTGWRRREGLVVKAASLFPANSAGDFPTIHSVAVLFDGEHGRPLAAIHGEAFTRTKTAADSALAADLLARRDAETLAVIGAGSQAETHIRFMMAVRPSVRRVTICNRTFERAEALAGTLRQAGIDAAPERNVERAVRGASIVSCLTGSTAPVVLGSWLAPGIHLDLVGGYTPDMRETDDDTLRRSRLFADTRRFTLGQCGDFSQAIAAGAIAAGDVEGDLFDLVSGACPPRRGDDEITLFKNGGGGHLDLMAARAFYDMAAADMVPTMER